MKCLALLFLICFFNSAGAQLVDSLASKQVDSLLRVSRGLSDKNQFEDALKINAIAEIIAVENLGKASAEYGNCCYNRGIINHLKSDSPEAEKWYLEAREIREKVYGKSNGSYANILNCLGELYTDMGKLDLAELHLIESASILENVFGKENSDYAISLNNLARIYFVGGSYEKAEAYWLETKGIRERVLGVEHPHYASSLNNLAALYIKIGKFEQVIPLLLETLSIRKKVQGIEHPHYASALNNLAAVYLRIGAYEKAEPLLLEAKSIQAKIYGNVHPDYARSVSNLASLYSRMGAYEKAESYYLENMTVLEKTTGKDQPQYATLLSSLSGLYVQLGKNDKVEPLLIEAKSIREKALGKSHPDYANSLVGLADLYSSIGQIEKAELNYLEASLIYENSFGKLHPDYAASIFKIAMMYYLAGQEEKAEPLLLEAYEIRQKIYGSEHPECIESLIALAHFYENHAHYAKSAPILHEVNFLTNSRMKVGLSFLSEDELSKYVLFNHRTTVQVNMFLYRRPYAHAGTLAALSYEQSIFHKGFLMQAAKRLRNLADKSPASRIINNDLKSCRKQISQQLSRPIAERKGLEVLEEKANVLEKELAAMVDGYTEAMKLVKWQDVQAILKPFEATLEFVHFNVDFPKKTDSTMYAALLLRPGATQPIFIPVFEEREFDHLLRVEKERKSDYVNELYAWADRGMVQLGSAKKSLYDLIWAKIEAAGLEGITTVYYSPSGVLHRLNLGAIAVDDETILSDRYHLVALNSTRQLVIPTEINAPSDAALLVGGVQFEVDSLLAGFEKQPDLAIRSTAEAWTESGTRGGTWSYLKWTEKEVERIASTLTAGGFKASQLTGSAATEEAIKTIGTEAASPRVLHIATHGFFFPDPEIAPAARRGMGEVEPVFKSSDNPMIRSGLIMAGGNYAWQHGRAPRSEMEDGILTAYEISQMNLANTELVVLSACETGLGDIQGNEGVYGLQRAFKIAGAKYLIMSLWQVPDRETMEFMTTFYRNWLEEKMTIPDAFRKTQGEMRDRFINPYSWAGFVLVE